MAEGRSNLHCPRCDWQFATRNTALQIEYCPRCLAQARRAIRLERGVAGTASDGAPRRASEDRAAQAA